MALHYFNIFVFIQTFVQIVILKIYFTLDRFAGGREISSDFVLAGNLFQDNTWECAPCHVWPIGEVIYGAGCVRNFDNDHIWLPSLEDMPLRCAASN